MIFTSPDLRNEDILQLISLSYIFYSFMFTSNLNLEDSNCNYMKLEIEQIP